VCPEPFVDAIVGKLIDADKKWIGPLCNLECITYMIPMSMGENNEIGGNVSRFNRRSWIVVKEGINQKNKTVVGSDLK
jgi:hypothetical protein